jgi:hypothetical protein
MDSTTAKVHDSRVDLSIKGEVVNRDSDISVYLLEVMNSPWCAGQPMRLRVSLNTRPREALFNARRSRHKEQTIMEPTPRFSQSPEFGLIALSLSLATFAPAILLCTVAASHLAVRAHT